MEDETGMTVEELRKLASQLFNHQVEINMNRAAAIRQLLADRADAQESWKQTLAKMNEELQVLGYRRPRLKKEPKPQAMAAIVAKKRAKRGNRKVAVPPVLIVDESAVTNA